MGKSVYGSVGVGNASGPTAKIGGVGSADLGGVGPNVYGKTHSQLGKINTYDKSGGFHTGTPPPYGLAGNATGAPLGVGVSVGVGGPSPYGAQHMFIPTLAHQSQHSHLIISNFIRILQADLAGVLKVVVNRTNRDRNQVMEDPTGALIERFKNKVYHCPSRNELGKKINQLGGFFFSF